MGWFALAVRVMRMHCMRCSDTAASSAPTLLQAAPFRAALTGPECSCTRLHAAAPRHPCTLPGASPAPEAPAPSTHTVPAAVTTLQEQHPDNVVPAHLPETCAVSSNTQGKQAFIL
jgi:hypothetical protein